MFYICKCFLFFILLSRPLCICQIRKSFSSHMLFFFPCCFQLLSLAYVPSLQSENLNASKSSSKMEESKASWRKNVDLFSFYAWLGRGTRHFTTLFCFHDGYIIFCNFRELYFCISSYFIYRRSWRSLTVINITHLYYMLLYYIRVGVCRTAFGWTGFAPSIKTFSLLFS